jgi:hypothetical protein
MMWLKSVFGAVLRIALDQQTGKYVVYDSDGRLGSSDHKVWFGDVLHNTLIEAPKESIGKWGLP